jgi:hypothetical protein
VILPTLKEFSHVSRLSQRVARPERFGYCDLHDRQLRYAHIRVCDGVRSLLEPIGFDGSAAEEARSSSPHPPRDGAGIPPLKRRGTGAQRPNDLSTAPKAGKDVREFKAGTAALVTTTLHYILFCYPAGPQRCFND